MTEKATDKQKKFMDELGLEYPSTITKIEASKLIDEKTGSKGSKKPFSNDKNKNIVAQVLTKCYCENQEAGKLTRDDVLTAYKYFVEAL